MVLAPIDFHYFDSWMVLSQTLRSFCAVTKFSVDESFTLLLFVCLVGTYAVRLCQFLFNTCNYNTNQQIVVTIRILNWLDLWYNTSYMLLNDKQNKKFEKIGGFLSFNFLTVLRDLQIIFNL